jgi:hypothetical protein
MTTRHFYSDFDLETLHYLARKMRRNMTPEQISRTARIANSNMLMQAKLRTQWQRLVAEQNGDTFKPLEAITNGVVHNLKAGD